MNKPFFLHIFIGITLILAACESKKKETQKNSWSIDEPQVVSQAGEIRAQITAFGRSAKDQKLYTSDKIRFKTQKGVTLYIDTTCSQLNHTFRHKTSLNLQSEIPILELLPIEVFNAPSYKTFTSCTFEFHAYNTNKDHHRFFLKSAMLKFDKKNENIKVYENNMPLRLDSTRHQDFLLDNISQMSIITATPGKQELRLRCSGETLAKTQMDNNFLPLSSINFTEFQRKTVLKKEHSSTCRFFIFQKNRLKGYSKLTQIHIPKPSLKVKTINPSADNNVRLYKPNKMINRYVQRTYITNNNFKTQHLMITIPRAHVKISAFAKNLTDSSITEYASTNIGIRYKLNTAGLKQPLPRPVEQTRRYWTFSLPPGETVSVDMNVKFKVTCHIGSQDLLGFALVPHNKKKAAPVIHIMNEPVNDDKSNKRLKTYFASPVETLYLYPNTRKSIFPIENILRVDQVRNFRSACQTK